jgi:glycosyltransferase involved in cell wall biosynthesis
MSKQKKILFILHMPPPVHGSSMVGKFINESLLLNHKFSTRYINLGTSKSIDEIGEKSLKKLFSYFKIIGSTLIQLFFFKPDIVYLAITAKGIAFYKDFLVVLLVKLFGVQLVLHFHNKGVSVNHSKTIDNSLYKLVFKNTKVILLSKYLYADIEKYVKINDVYYCPNGIPDIEIKKSLATKSNKTILNVLFLSNLIESKGVYVLLEACGILQKKQLNFQCTFVGGIGDVSESQFNKIIKELNIESLVVYAGKKYGFEKDSAFAKADIFVLPTFSECFPLVLLEAMQYSLPIVSTFEGGIPDIVEDGITGFLVSQKNAEALADKLEILINNPEMRRKMGTAGGAKYEREFTISTFENNLNNILNVI